MESSFRQTFLHYTLLHYEHASNFCNDRECTFRQTNIAALYFTLHFTLHYIMTMSVISAMTGNPPSGKETLLCYTSLHYEPVSNFCYDRKSSLIQTDIAACCITLRYIMSMRVISAMTEIHLYRNKHCNVTLRYIMSMQVISAMTGNSRLDKETLLCYTL